MNQYRRPTDTPHKAPDTYVANEDLEWALRAEDGTTSRSSGVLARRAATETGWTLNDSPVEVALYRVDAHDEWHTFDPNNPPGHTAQAPRHE